MATTSPDEIYSPDAGQQYALTQDLLLMADSVQDALNDRAVMLSGSGAPGSLPAANGSTYRDSATGREYKRVSGAWYQMGVGFWANSGQAIDGGSVIFPGTAGSMVSFSVGSAIAPNGGCLSVAGSIFLAQNTVTSFAGMVQLRRGGTVTHVRRWHSHGRALNAWVPFNFNLYPTTPITTSETFTLEITNDSTSAGGIEIWDAQWDISASFVSPR